MTGPGGCLSEQLAVQFVDGGLDAAERARIEAHLDECESCCGWIAGLIRTSPHGSGRAFADTLPLGEPGLEWREAGNAALAPGQTLGRYRVVEVLGQGAMGIVFRAFDPVLERHVAIKIVRGAGSSSRKLQALREAQALAKLQHPNVIAVHDIGFFDEQVFVAMELVEGETLASWLGQRRPWSAIRDVFLQAARGLAAAHQAGLVHRDFKPENVLLAGDGSRIVVTDFGLVFSLGAGGNRDDGDDNGSRLLAGTPAYMAPEQFSGDAVDARTDVFNFCAALFEAVFAQPAFAGESFAERRRAVLDGNFRKPPANPSAPRWLERVLKQGLAREPEARPASMVALMRALEHDRRVRRGLFAGAALALLLAVALGSAGIVSYRDPSAACRRRARSIESAWSAPVRARLAAAFARARLPFGDDAARTVTTLVQRYVDAWTAAYADTCDATYRRGAQSTEGFELRLDCLDARRDGLEQLLDRLQSADPSMVEKAVGAVSVLEAPASCNRQPVSARLVVPPLLRREVQAARRKLAEVRSYELVGKYDIAEARVGPLLPAARALGFAPLIAETLERVAYVHRDRGRWHDSEVAFTGAFDSAERSGDDARRAAAAIELVDVLGVRQTRFAEAERWSDEADAILARLGRPAASVARLSLSRGLVLRGEAKPERAQAELEAACELYRQLPEGEVLAPITLNQLASVVYDRGDYARAAAMMRDAHEQLRARLGAAHPTTLAIAGNLGTVEGQLGHLHEAQRILEAVLAAQTAALGPAHPTTIETLSNLAGVEGALGQYERAIPHAEEALAAAQKADRDSPKMEHYQLNLALFYAARGDDAAAQRLAEAARASRVARLGADHALVGDAEFELARIALDAERVNDAAIHAERARALLTRAYGEDHAAVARVLDVLGEIDRAHGHYDDAVAKDERATRLLAAAHDAILPLALTHLGDVERLAGRRAAARATLERALELRRTVEGDAQEGAATDFALAQVLDDDAPRARRLAAQALAAFSVAAPRFHREAAQARDWLAHHAQRSRP